MTDYILTATLIITATCIGTAAVGRRAPVQISAWGVNTFLISRAWELACRATDAGLELLPPSTRVALVVAMSAIYAFVAWRYDFVYGDKPITPTMVRMAFAVRRPSRPAPRRTAYASTAPDIRQSLRDAVDDVIALDEHGNAIGGAA